jgi:hypothetical protein
MVAKSTARPPSELPLAYPRLVAVGQHGRVPLLLDGGLAVYQTAAIRAGTWRSGRTDADGSRG